MKIITNFIQALAMLILTVTGLALFSSCGGSKSDPEPSIEEVTRTKLTANIWKVQDVVVDGTDKTTIYKDLSIQFNNAGFTSANGGAIWPASGTWSFVGADAKAIKRNDGLEVQISEVTETTLKLSFAWSKTTLNGGRGNSISGQHVFNMTK